MFHKILIAIDRSELSQHAFSEALTLAKSVKSDLVLLHVLSPEDEESPSSPSLSEYAIYPAGLSRSITEIYQELWESYAERGLEIVKSLAEKAIAQGVNATFHQSFGSPGKVICEFARNSNIDLIMVGRRGLSGLNELLLGSVSNYVLHHAPCSVLIVQGTPSVNSEPDQIMEPLNTTTAL